MSYCFNPFVKTKELGRLSAPKNTNSLFYALELARCYQLIDNGAARKRFDRLLNAEGKTEELAMGLIERAGIGGKSYGTAQLNLVQKYWDQEYPEMFRIVAFDMKSGLNPIFKGENVRKYEVCIILDNGHWDGLKSVSQFFNIRKLCVSCEVTYDWAERHRTDCKERCKKCCRMGYGFPCKSESLEIYCEECNRKFWNRDCFEAHKKRICKMYKKCKKCRDLYRTRDKHVCGEKFCKRCMVYHPGRQCFIKKIKIRPTLPRYRIVAYDLETTVVNGEHTPNLVSAAMTCSVCVGADKECEICGLGPKTITWSMADGFEPMCKFVDWIMGFKNFETIAFAHYGGRFDSHFVLKELTDRGVKSELMMGDLKIYQIKAGKVFFRDFWMLSQNRLAELPKTLELDIPAKLFFPHRFNKNENFGRKTPHLPPFEDYCPGGMKEADYANFEKWYNENYETEFELSEQLKMYCENDVEILMASVLKFRKLFLDITKDMDVIKDSVTIASIVMKIFRGKFLKERHIPIVPEGGFEKADNQSKIAVKYMEWLAYRDGVKVRHACNGGEVKFGDFKVDGVIGAQKKIIEFQGCAWHGCTKCFLPWTVCPNGLTADQNFRRTKMRMDQLSEICGKMNLEEVWECDVKVQLKKNREMKKFFDSVPDKGPINPRDAYGGGRTMPFCLYAAASESLEISMFDIISLYPFVNYDSPYPVGIPKIIKSRSYRVCWTRPDDVPYNGLLKVKVIPPKKLMYPLLSIHADDMLLFPNCGVCARRAKKDFIMAKDVKKCLHRPQQRALLGTFTSIELRKALELGYKVIGFYRAYHFEEFDTQLFKNYVRMFLKIKVEASGWPTDAKTEEEKKSFIDLYRAKYDIYLDGDNIKKNPGLRLIAKLGLNSLWGKFSMRNTLSTTEIVDKIGRWDEIMRDDTIEFAKPTKINETMMRVIYKKKEEFIKEHNVSNIILSLWTTSAARIKLYEYMEKVYRADGCKLLYCDTDSLIFTHPRGICPLREGNFLGEMTREYADNDILEYVAAGPKQYSLKLKKKTDGQIWHKTKIRGITMNRDNEFTYGEFKKMVLEYKEGEKKEFRYPEKIGPTRDSRVLSKDTTKDYGPVQRKGIIGEDWNVLPFGFY